MAERNPNQTIILEATHVDQALAYARPLDFEDFRISEMEWLNEHFSFLRLKIMEAFGRAYERNIPDPDTHARVTMTGQLVANYAIRTCTGEDGYHLARANFIGNIERDATRPITEVEAVLLAPWDTEDALMKIFRDSDLVVSINSINNPQSRNAAIVEMVYMCFSELPEVTPPTTDQVEVAAIAE